MLQGHVGLLTPPSSHNQPGHKSTSLLNSTRTDPNFEARQASKLDSTLWAPTGRQVGNPTWHDFVTPRQARSCHNHWQTASPCQASGWGGGYNQACLPGGLNTPSDVPTAAAAAAGSRFVQECAATSQVKAWQRGYSTLCRLSRPWLGLTHPGLLRHSSLADPEVLVGSLAGLASRAAVACKAAAGIIPELNVH